MFKKLIISLCLTVVPFYAFSQPMGATSPSDSTASPTVSTDEREAPKDEKKSLKDLVITEPQFPAVITTEEKEKKE